MHLIFTSHLGSSPHLSSPSSLSSSSCIRASSWDTRFSLLDFWEPSRWDNLLFRSLFYRRNRQRRYQIIFLFNKPPENWWKKGSVQMKMKTKVWMKWVGRCFIVTAVYYRVFISPLTGECVPVSPEQSCHTPGPVCQPSPAGVHSSSAPPVKPSPDSVIATVSHSLTVVSTHQSRSWTETTKSRSARVKMLKNTRMNDLKGFICKLDFLARLHSIFLSKLLYDLCTKKTKQIDSFHWIKVCAFRRKSQLQSWLWTLTALVFSRHLLSLDTAKTPKTSGIF